MPKGKGKKKGKKMEKKIVRLIKKEIAIESELKRYDYAELFAAPAVIGATWLVTDIFLPAQGLTDLNRVGDRVKLTKRMELKGYVEPSLTAVANYSAFRLVVIQWHPNTVPAASDVFVSTTGPTINQITNMDTRQEYKILFDKTYKIAYEGTTNPTNVSIQIPRFNKTFKAMQSQVQFVNTGTVGTNKIYLFRTAWLGGTDTLSCNFTTRLYYRDS